jgi:magnesium transporter
LNLALAYDPAVIDAQIHLDNGSWEPIDPDSIDLHRAGQRGLLWVDVPDPSPAELALLASEFDLHPLALEGAVQHNERSKVERFPTHAFIVLYDTHGSKVTMFVGPAWVITARSANDEGHIWTSDLCRHKMTIRSGKSAPGTLVHRIIDNITDGYEDQIDSVATQVETLEEGILDSFKPASDATQRDMLRLRRQLLDLRRRVIPARDVVQELRRGRSDSFDDDEVDLALADVHDHLLRIVDQVDAERELLGNAFDAHLAMMSNQMNLVMKKLTAWGSILFGAGLIAGIYGMNFTHMPELDWKLGYPMALGSMVALSLILRSIFKRRDWL